MLKTILAITGKTGLFRLVSRGNNMLIVESLVDGKRMPTYTRDKVVSLGEISMFTNGDDVSLSEVLTSLGKHENNATCSVDLKKATTDDLRAFFAKILPDFDRDRVYPSDIRKLIQWYNILINAGITDFSLGDEDTGKEEVAPIQEVKEEKKTATPKKQVKTQKSAATSIKTGVGARKG